MLKEDDKLTDALIEFIQALPEAKREKIAKNITPKKKTKPKRAIRAKTNKRKKLVKYLDSSESPLQKSKGKGKSGTNRKDSFDEMSKYLDSLGSRLPVDYKFDREEANER